VRAFFGGILMPDKGRPRQARNATVKNALGTGIARAFPRLSPRAATTEQIVPSSVKGGNTQAKG